jgi:very-short-patch-repair endonuclease
MRYQWGPLLRDGGERRLNVAATRARQRLAVVSSFSSHDVDPGRLTKPGARMLADYLEYAGSGGVPVAATGSAAGPDPFGADVVSRLAAAGICVVPRYGVGGYRVDFAAAHPGDQSRMILAIEADGLEYRDSGSVRDRDRLRKEHLERLGWRVHRLWSTSWFADPQAEMARLRAAYEDAVEAHDVSAADVDDAAVDDAEAVGGGVGEAHAGGAGVAEAHAGGADAGGADAGGADAAGSGEATAGGLAGDGQVSTAWDPRPAGPPAALPRAITSGPVVPGVGADALPRRPERPALPAGLSTLLHPALRGAPANALPAVVPSGRDRSGCARDAWAAAAGGRRDPAGGADGHGRCRTGATRRSSAPCRAG